MIAASVMVSLQMRHKNSSGTGSTSSEDDDDDGSSGKKGGFYLGSIGGPAAILAQNNIKSIECVEYPELGMEAIWKIEVENFPAFILVDDKGNDFFKQLKPWNCTK